MGDWFNAFDATFVLIKVEKHMFQWIANLHWKDEGCSNYEDFIGVWKQIHPRKIVKDKDEFWVHIFQNVSRKPLNPWVKIKDALLPDLISFMKESSVCEKDIVKG